ncbi:hypothetical protein ACX0G7_27110 [Flavitalea antarctica]
MVLAKAGGQCLVNKTASYARLRQYLYVVRHCMKLVFRIFFGIAILFSGFIAIKIALGGYFLGIFNQIQYLFFGLLLLFTLAAFLLDSLYYQTDNNVYQYGVTAVGLVFCAVVSVIIFQHHSIDGSKTIFEVSTLPGANNVFTIEFKENNRFRLTEFDRSQQTIYYGQYEKRGDALLILSSNFTNRDIRFPKAGRINNDTIYWNQFDTMLVSWQ